MTNDEIRIGKTYRIRGWDDLAAEYGTDNYGTSSMFIKTIIPFGKKHREKCGERFTIKSMLPGQRESEPHYFTFYLSEEGVEVLGKHPDGRTEILVITAAMLEPLDEPPVEIPRSPIMDFLMGLN